MDNKLTDEDTKLGVELRFKSLDDFHPEKVAKQIEPLRKLAEARGKLSDLLNKLDGNDKLEELLQQVIQSTEDTQKLAEQVGLGEAKESNE